MRRPGLPGPYSALYRVTMGDTEPVYFWTILAARVHAALLNERQPRGRDRPPVVEMRELVGGAWYAIRRPATLAPQPAILPDDVSAFTIRRTT